MFKNFVVAVLCIAAVSAVDFEIQNHESGDVWVGIQGNPNHPHLNNGGFVLAPGKSVVVNAPEDWAGRFWGRSYCNPSNNHCDTGDCGNRKECNGAGGNPPATLAEITLKGAGGLDFYDLSLVDGFNLRMSFEPINGQGDGSKYSCKKAKCFADINHDCPNELKLTNSAGVIGCKSACLALNTDLYCCRGQHATPDTCKHEDWPVDYSQFFKTRCPDAYSYAYDDHKSTFTCKAEKYVIAFGVS